jgi:hypothetical protein
VARVEGVQEREAIKAVFLCVENTAPHEVAVYEPDLDAMALADEQIDDLLATLVECREKDAWPGRYEAEVVRQRAPAWAFPAGEGETGDYEIVSDDEEAA